MKLLLFSAYYEPEVAASLYLSTNLYEDFASSGMSVKLFVPLPTRGVTDQVRNQYRKINESKINGNLIIKRVNIPREHKSTVLRALRYGFMNLVFICKSFRCDADAIFVQSTPPTQGAMAAIIKKFKKIPFIYNLQDVFPDSMGGMGLTKKGSLIYKIGRRIENYTYKNADKIIVISDDIKSNIIEKGVPEEKIVVVSNWIDSDVVHPIPDEDNYLFEKFNIPKNKFLVTYAGNLGYAQNIDVIIEAARDLEYNNDIVFVIFGKGAQEDEYRYKAKNLNNIMFFPIQPYSEVSYVYSMGDVSIVPCRKGIGSGAMPSKTWSIMATGTPVLASFDKNTSMEKLLSEEKVGLFSDADDHMMLSQNILKLFGDKDLCNEYGRNAREYVKKNLSREKCTKEYIEVINNVACLRKE